MNFTDKINLIISVVSIVIALSALLLSYYQILLSNKQSLFDRRIRGYLRIKDLFNLYETNKEYLQYEKDFYHINDLIFSFLTNSSELEEMTNALSQSLSSDGHKRLLSIREEYKKFAVETRMIFPGESGECLSSFVDSYIELLFSMYKMQCFINNIKETNKQKDYIPTIEEYENECKKMFDTLDIFSMTKHLNELYDEIVMNNYLDVLEEKLKIIR